MAQGPGLSQPLEGERKITAYVDHDCPFGQNSSCPDDLWTHHYSGLHWHEVVTGGVGLTWMGPYAYEGHEGTDYSVTTGNGVLATARGKVVTRTYVSGYGYHVVIDHGGGLRTDRKSVV